MNPAQLTVIVASPQYMPLLLMLQCAWVNFGVHFS